MIPNSGLILHFLMIGDMEHLLTCWLFVCLLLKNASSDPVVYVCICWLLSCMSSLCILDINPFSDV